MIKQFQNGYEYFECSKCGEQVDEFDDMCQICGHYFQRKTRSSFSKEKFIALNFSEMQISEDKKLILATLQNARIGTKKFAIPEGTQLANRIKYFVINGNRGYLEDGLMQDKLVILEDFIELNISIEGNIENVLTHKTLV